MRVLVADDEIDYRETVVNAVRARPELELVGETGKGAEVVETVRELRPDVLLVDPKMPDLDVVAALEQGELRTSVLVLSARLEVQTVYTMVEAGAKGYLSKEATPDEVCEGVVNVMRGDLVLAPQLQLALAREIQRRTEETKPLLNARELEVLVLISQGFSPYDVCRRLYLSPQALNTYVGGFCAKLGVEEVEEAVVEARKRGLFK